MTDRILRFSDLVAPDRWALEHVAVIGCGAIGRQLALLLSRLPLGSLTLVDPDTVSEVNLGPQGYNPPDIGLPKTQALARDCAAHNPSLPLHTHNLRLSSLSDLGVIAPPPTFVFLCVDSMTARSTLSASCTCPLIDTRMAAQTAHVIHRDPASPAPYTSTLFPDSEALQEPCTLRSTPWCASACAALALCHYSHLLRGNPLSLPSHHILNLVTFELFSPTLTPSST